MTEEKHTAGPWRIEGRRGPGYIISAGVNAEGDGPAAYVGVLDPMFYIAGEPSGLEADARLIISAPDLLAALKKLTMLARTSGGTAGRDEPLMVACETAEAAISRATGAA